MKSLKKTAALLLAAALALSLAACGAAARPVGVWKYEMEVGRFFHTTAEQLADELDKNGNGAAYTQKQIETLAEKLNGVFEGVTVTLVMDLREDETWELFYDEAACDAAEAKVREGYRGFVVAVLAILAWALLSSRRKKTVGESSYKDPPYIVALRKLERFRGDRYWAPDKQKTMYSGITDALREYIDSRYGIDAPEMTTAELFESLKDTDIPGDLLKDMRGLFETADLVKFAKSYATQEENAAAVPLAVRFVTSTYQAPSAGPATGGGNGTEPAGQEEGGTE